MCLDRTSLAATCIELHSCVTRISAVKPALEFSPRCLFFFFSSAWRQDKSYCNIWTQSHAVSRTLCVMWLLKKYTFMPKGNRPDAFMRAIASGLEATFSLKDDEMHTTCVLRRWHTAAQAHCSTNLLAHAYSAVL